MTSLLDRPTGRTGSATSATPRAVPLAGLLGAGWAAAVSLAVVVVVVLVAWAGDGRSGASADTAGAAALQVWLLANRAVLGLPHGTFALAPIGLTALPLLLLARAGRHAAREAQVRTWRQAGWLVLAFCAAYAVVTAAATSLAGSVPFRPEPLSALLGGSAVVTLGAGWGVLHETGLARRLADRLPEPVRRMLPAGAAALGALLAAGALLAGASLAAHAGGVGAVLHGLDPGVVGTAALLLLSVLLVPNAAVLGAAYAAGPGFALGTGTVVSPLAVHVGDVPALPLLAAVPAHAPVWAGALLTLPALAGIVAGVVLARGGVARRSWRDLLVDTAGAGVLAGAAMAALAALAGGPAGPGRLAAVGPSPWQCGLAVAGWVAAAALATAAVARWRGWHLAGITA